MSIRRASLSLMVLLYPLTGLAQQIEHEKGAIESLREPLRLLLKLTWDGDHLVIDRTHWNEADVEIPQDDSRQPRGFLTRQFERARGSTGEVGKAATLFTYLKYKAGAHSGGGGGGGDRLRGRGYGDTVETTINTSATHFRFKISERSPPSRTLDVRYDESNALQITLLSRVTLHFRQNADGKVAIIEAYDDQIHRYEGESFASLRRKYPEFVRDRFFPALDQFGIIVPPVDPKAEENVD